MHIRKPMLVGTPQKKQKRREILFDTTTSTIVAMLILFALPMTFVFKMPCKRPRHTLST
jgi:hypothetical protein